MAIFFANLARKAAETLTPNVLSSSRSYISEMRRSTLKENLIRVVRTEITFSSSNAPATPSPPSSFSIDERPGEKWIRLTRTLAGESVRIDATMIDGAVPKEFDHTEPINEFDPHWAPHARLHISLVVEISKGVGTSGGVMHAVCSAWPNSLDVHNVYTLPPEDGSRPAQPFLGPNFKNGSSSPFRMELDDELQRTVRNYLEEKGVNDELAKFLHQYIKSKAQREFVAWLKNVEAHVENRRV